MGSRPKAKNSKARWLFAMVLTVTCFFAYDPWRFENTSGDNISARYWPVAIIKHHSVMMTPFKKDLQGVDYAAIYLNNGDWLPRVNWGLAVFAVPFYETLDLLNVGGKDWTHNRI